MFNQFLIIKISLIWDDLIVQNFKVSSRSGEMSKNVDFDDYS